MSVHRPIRRIRMRRMGRTDRSTFDLRGEDLQEVERIMEAKRRRGGIY
ncbi:hypothetical protein GCM10022225_80130 [Plantactinospora mayteni]|uniref:Uncharacterized protein n=1 Tax=Plantactinospora mayteni TaxID=566021 RepID=A0ABQ4F396_9ACTN|nr:hypothetical protein [Plantactinospora mayteni]GIH01362.1 hypothetical protein Pma05_79340 [Plantactinospora mayteni]